MNYLLGFLTGVLLLNTYSYHRAVWLLRDEWQCSLSHREGPEHNQHDVCDRYTRKAGL